MKTVSTKLAKWYSLLVAAMMAFASLGFVACSDGGDDDGGTEQTQSGSITISSSSTTAPLGDTVSISVSFSDFDTNPTTVDVYVEEASTAIATDVTLTNSAFSFGTGEYDTGSYKLYVKSGSVESNHLAVTLTSDLDAPTNVQVTLDTTNKVKITCDGNASYYWFYYSKTNDSSTATYIDYELNKSETLILSESGTYYFWVKAAENHGSTESARGAIKTSAFSEVASYTFTHTALEAPTNVQVVAAKTNQVKITCDGNASYYWFYYSKTNDSSTATYIDYELSKSETLMLTESGTYYFWVKASDGHATTETARAEIAQSNFSEVKTYEFTHQTLTAPTGVTVTADTTKNEVKISCTDNNAAYYWFYYSKTNNTETAEYFDYELHAYETKELTESGTYYFWVKAADGHGYTATAREAIGQSPFSEAVSYTFTLTE